MVHNTSTTQTHANTPWRLHAHIMSTLPITRTFNVIQAYKLHKLWFHYDLDLWPLTLKTFSTEFTEAVNGGNGICKHMALPYNAHYLNYNLLLSFRFQYLMNMRFKIIRSCAIYTILLWIIPLVSSPVSKHKLSNINMYCTSS